MVKLILMITQLKSLSCPIPLSFDWSNCSLFISILLFSLNRDYLILLTASLKNLKYHLEFQVINVTYVIAIGCFLQLFTFLSYQLISSHCFFSLLVLMLDWRNFFMLLIDFDDNIMKSLSNQKFFVDHYHFWALHHSFFFCEFFLTKLFHFHYALSFLINHIFFS